MACIGRRQGVLAQIRSKASRTTGSPNLKNSLSVQIAWLPDCLIFTDISQL